MHGRGYDIDVESTHGLRTEGVRRAQDEMYQKAKQSGSQAVYRIVVYLWRLEACIVTKSGLLLTSHAGLVMQDS